MEVEYDLDGGSDSGEEDDLFPVAFHAQLAQSTPSTRVSMVIDSESDAEMEPSSPMPADDVAGLHGCVHGGVYIAANDGEHDYDGVRIPKCAV